LYQLKHSIQHIRTRLNEENARVRRYLDETHTRKPLIAIVEKQLIDIHAAQIIDKGKIIRHKCKYKISF
jgi:hypothetical protein